MLEQQNDRSQAESAQKRKSSIKNRKKLLVILVKLKAEEVTNSFIKYIDMNLECLCPIVLTNNMNIEFECENELVQCTISFKSNYELDYMGITSNLLLNNLLKIEVDESSESNSVIRQDLNVKRFKLRVLESEYSNFFN